MKVVLNPALKRVPPYKPFELTDDVIGRFASSRARACKVQNIKRFVGAELNPDIEGLHQGWLNLLATAYSRHEKVRIAPHDLWFIVMSELAKEVNRAPETYRTLFTESKGDKETIAVPTGDVETIDVNLLVDALRSKVLVPMEIFLPSLTTTTPDVTAALAATFCDMVQSYYGYGTFMCGIPEIEVTGTPEDWATLAANTGAIKIFFENVGAPQNVVSYLAVVGRLFTLITGDVASGEPDVAFWKATFTAKNVGSGGQLEISGWIKDLYLEKRPDSKLENFTGSVGVVPYYNFETKRQFTAIYGAFGQLRSPEGFIYSSYDHIVFERQPANG